jgi:galactokinase
MVALVEEEAVEAFAEQVIISYAQRSGVQPRVYPVRAAPGAGVLG